MSQSSALQQSSKGFVYIKFLNPITIELGKRSAMRHNASRLVHAVSNAFAVSPLCKPESFKVTIDTMWQWILINVLI